MMEKCAKDQADGKCSRTSLFPSTVGIALARSGRAICNSSDMQDLIELEPGGDD
jgi:hypothetical protein